MHFQSQYQSPGNLNEIGFFTDCDMIIQTDRGVSRLHAEIIVDAMCPTLSHDGSTCTNVHVRDHSKFGTFVNKKDASKAVHSRPNKVETLKDGDVISFGTGNASFRWICLAYEMAVHFIHNFFF